MPQSGFLQFKRLLNEMNQAELPSSTLINDYHFYTELVQSATQCEPGFWFITDITSCERSNRDMLPCEAQTRMSENPDKIRWECKKCRLSGVITQFEESPFDSRITSGDNPFLSGPDMKALLLDSALVEIRMPEKTYSVLKEVLETGQPDGATGLHNLAEFLTNEVSLTLPVPLAMMIMNSMELYLKEFDKHKKSIEKLLKLFELETMKTHINVIAGYLRGEHTLFKAVQLLGLQDQKDMDELEDLRQTLEEQADEQNISLSEVIEQFVTNQINAIPDRFEKNIGGLSSIQIDYLCSQNDWMHNIGGIKINYEALDPDIARSFPFMKNVQALYKHVLESGGKLSLGRDGRFLKETIQYMIDNGVWPEYSMEWRSKHRSNSSGSNSREHPENENSNSDSKTDRQSLRASHLTESPSANQIDDFFSTNYYFIEQLANVLVLSGLFTIKKRKFIPVRAKADYLMTRNAPKLYALMLQTLYLEYDMVSRFGDDSTGELIAYIQDHVTYALYQLHQMKGSTMKSAKALTDQLMHPGLFEVLQYAPTPEESKIQRVILDYLCFSVYIEPLSRFGLAEMSAGDPSLLSFKYKARKTPLFDSLITFGL
ncbi:MAG: hypothetical protein ACNA8K_09170 [Cyclonatronaceae bacterium]